MRRVEVAGLRRDRKLPSGGSTLRLSTPLGRGRRRLRLASLLAIACAVRAAAPTAVPLVNPGFEGSYYAVSNNGGLITGMVANGWADNSTWSNSTVQYSQELSNPHGGASCQKMAVQSVASGEAQLLQGISLVAGSLYTASIWLRAQSATDVTVPIQDASPPYPAFLDTMIPIGTAWQQVTVQGYVVTNTSANLMVALPGPGTVWIDDASVSYTPGIVKTTPNLGPIPTSFFGIHVANFLQATLSNPGFEPPFVPVGQNNQISGNVAMAWSDNSSWADVIVTYGEDTNNPHGGTSAQQVAVQAIRSGAVQMVQVCFA